MTKKNPNPKSELTFEESLAKLESIVNKMESGKLGLDKMIEHFEQGSQLIKTCTAKLDEVEQKIEKLVKKDGKIQTVDFDAE